MLQAKPAAKKKVKKPKKKTKETAKPAAKPAAKPVAKTVNKVAKTVKKSEQPVKKEPEVPVDEDEFVEAEYQGGMQPIVTPCENKHRDFYTTGMFTAVITSTETKKAERKILGKSIVKEVVLECNTNASAR